MWFKRFCVWLVSLALIYAPVAYAQTVSGNGYAGWSKVLASDGVVRFMAPVGSGTGSRAIGNTIWNSAVPSGSSLVHSATLPTASGPAAVKLAGRVTGAAVFATARAMVGGPLGVTLTALTVAPAVIDYFLTDHSRLGPLSARESDKPFEMQQEVTECANGTCTGYVFRNVNYSTAQAACSAIVAYRNSIAPANYSYALDTCTVGSTFVSANMKYYYMGALWGSTSGSASKITLPPTTGLEWVPASMDDIAPYMDKPVPGPQMDALINAGADFPITSPSVTGPPSVAGEPTVTTTNDGTNTTTSTTIPTTTLKYSTGTHPDTGKPAPIVTATTGTVTNTTVINNISGDTISNITSTTVAPTPKETPDLCAVHPEIVACASVDELDMCKKYPDSLACQKTDQPEVPDLEAFEKPITFSPDGGWGGAGSCPAPRPLASAVGAEFSFQPFCDFMSAIRPVLVGVAWFSGALILVGANRKD